MKIIHKTLFIIGSLFIVLLFFILLFSFSFFLTGYYGFEENEMQLNALRVSQSFHEDIYSLEKTGADWAIWDELYFFVKDKGQNFSIDSFIPATEESSYNTFNTIFLFDNNDQLIMDSRILPPLKRDTFTDDDLTKYLRQKTVKFKENISQDMMSGIIILPNTKALALFHKIYQEQGNEPSSGTLVLLRDIDNSFIDNLSIRTKLTIEGYTREEGSLLFPEIEGIFSSDSTKQTKIIPLNSEKIIAILPINDLDGNVSYILKISSSRTIYEEASRTVYFFIVALFLVILFTLIIIYFVFTRLIINPLIAMDSRIKEISETRNLRTPVSVEGEKEIRELAESFNTLFNRLSMEEMKIIMSKRQYLELADQMDSAVIILDSKQDIVYSNVACNHFKENADDIIFCQDMTQGSNLLLPEGVKKIIISNSIHGKITREIITTNISNIKTLFEISIFPLAGEYGSTYKTVLIIRNITKFVETEEKLKNDGLLQLTENLEKFRNLDQEINIPLLRINDLSERYEQPEKDRIQIQIQIIQDIISEMKRTWIKSEKIHRFLLKYYNHGHRIANLYKSDKNEANDEEKKE